MARAVAVVFVIGGCCSSAFAWAADKVDPSGTWKWSMTINNQTINTTLKLKLEGDKLTGTMSRNDSQEVKIDDGQFKDGEVSFSVTRERNGQKQITKYKGKVDGDTIKGKAERERDGQKNERDWEARRETK
ncbi:MAG: hypothetical protein JSS02_20035 [Planctomycetes bacterium]|nr:hypothetical protein [Planctomycetota bacterium]